jgi:hypothetical protein
LTGAALSLDKYQLELAAYWFWVRNATSRVARRQHSTQQVSLRVSGEAGYEP